MIYYPKTTFRHMGFVKSNTKYKKYDAVVNLYTGIVYYPWATKKRKYIVWQPYKKICPKSLAF